MEPQQKHLRFSELLEEHVLRKVQKKFEHAEINTDMLRSMRGEVHGTVKSIFAKSSLRLSENSIEWLSNQMFKSIKFGTSDGDIPVNEIVVFNDHKLSELPLNDVKLLSDLFDSTKFGAELLGEYRRRAAS